MRRAAAGAAHSPAAPSDRSRSWSRGRSRSRARRPLPAGLRRGRGSACSRRPLLPARPPRLPAALPAPGATRAGLPPRDRRTYRLPVRGRGAAGAAAATAAPLRRLPGPAALQQAEDAPRRRGARGRRSGVRRGGGRRYTGSAVPLSVCVCVCLCV